MSEIRRLAKALVETRVERFESRHPREEAERRLDAGLARARLAGATLFARQWSAEGQVLEATFAPVPRTQVILRMLSLGIAAAVGVSVWVLANEEGAVRFLMPLFTGLAILALPFVAVALGSQREAEEERIRRAIRVALLDEEERLPPQQRWEDED